MRSFNPKQRLIPIASKSDVVVGPNKHERNVSDIVYKAPISPLPVEYKDIDDEFHKFIEEALDISFNGKKVPLFTMYSLQRFSEKQQMSEHSDSDGNPLTNFMTVTRENNPQKSSVRNETFNIPGDRDYTYLIREVLADNGTEHYEVHTMKQPFGVDLTYTLNFICTSFEMLNTFNMKLNRLFSSIQKYIKPNGHNMRVNLIDISDSTTYGTEEQKFFIQTAKFQIPAYIIMSEDFQVKLVPKRIAILMDGDKAIHSSGGADVCITECPTEDGDVEFKNVVVTISFKEFEDLVKFEIDDDVNFLNFNLTNVRRMKVFVNNMSVFHDEGFEVKNGDEIKVKIIPVDQTKPSEVILGGKSKTKTFSNTSSELAYDDFDNYSTDFIDVIP